MAKELSEWPAGLEPRSGRGATALYDWASLLNGNVWRLDSEDTKNPKGFGSSFRSQANGAGLGSRVNFVEAENAVYVQATQNKRTVNRKPAEAVSATIEAATEDTE